VTIYPIVRYPREIELRDGLRVALRPAVPADRDALLAFFRRIPAADRYFLKDDVASAQVVASFTDALDYDRALPLLAFDGDRLIADAVLIRHRGGYRRHGAEIRVVVEPEYRGKGLGVTLIRELTDIAWDAELEYVEFELIADVQGDAIAAAEFVGAFEVGTVREFAKDEHGDLHDLVVLRIPLGKWWQWSTF
jgi:GNAT superfamily N-acetyltransferase